MQKVGSWNLRPFLKMRALTFPLFNFPIHKQEVNHHQWRTYKVQCLYTQLWRSRNTNKSFSSTWLSQSSFKLLINWAVIMMCQWGWRGRNNLQVGEMRHEWLPSLTCAMLLVCVRSRQIPSVLSPFASVMGGWEHQLPPLPCFLLFFCREPNSLSPGCCFMEVQGVHVAPSLREQAWKMGHLLQLPSSTYWTGHGQRVNSTAWEKRSKEIKLPGALRAKAHYALPSSSWPYAQLDYRVLSSAYLPQQFRLYLCCTEQSGSGISDLALKYQLTSEK